MSPASGAPEPSAPPNPSDSDVCASRVGPPRLVRALGIILRRLLVRFSACLIALREF